MDDITLCIPPMSCIGYPHIAIPLLTSFTDTQGYSASVYDMNIGFLNFFLKKFGSLIRQKLMDEGKYDEFQFYRVVSRLLGISSARPKDLEAFYAFAKTKRHFINRLLESFLHHSVKSHLTNDVEILGLTVMGIASYHSAIKIAEKTKGFNQDAFTLLGGSLFGYEMATYTVSRYPFIDAVVVGEGERALIEILRNYKRHPEHLNDVKGIVIRLQNGKIRTNPPQLLIENLDELPFPDYSRIPLEDYLHFRLKTRILPIMASRGCTGNCSFCCERKKWDHYRSRTPANVVEEMKCQIEKHNVRVFRFCDSLINAHLKKLEELCDLLIRERLDIIWCANARVNRSMEGKLLRKMFKAGCRQLWYGLESASPRMLKLMKKGIDINDAPRVLKETKHAGISTLIHWISNFPGEKWEDTEKTASFIRANKKYMDAMSISRYHVVRDSDMYSNPDKYGLVIEQNDGPILRYKATNTVDNHAFLCNVSKSVPFKNPFHPYRFVEPL